MKRNKFIIQPGKICSLDRNNTALKQDSSGIVHVEVLRLVKKGLFGKNVWEVKEADDPTGQSFKCLEEHLFPEGMSIIRFPANIPEFDRRDIKALEDALIYNLPKDTTKRLEALKEKIEFCVHLKEV